MSERHPNFRLHTVHVSQIDQDTFQPWGGWNHDKEYDEDDEDSRDDYIDITDMSPSPNQPVDILESGKYMINSLGWMISKTGQKDPELGGDKQWRRIGGTKRQGYTVVIPTHWATGEVHRLSILLHHLVMVGFGDPQFCPADFPTDHKDRNRSNNNIHNLRYVTCEDNVKHSQVGNHTGNLRVNNSSSETGVSLKHGYLWTCELLVRGKYHYKGFPQSSRDPDIVPDEAKTCMREWRRRYLGIDEEGVEILGDGPLQLRLGDVVSNFDTPHLWGIVVDIYQFHRRYPSRKFRVGYPDMTKDCKESDLVVHPDSSHFYVVGMVVSKFLEDEEGVMKGRIIDVKLDSQGRRLPWEILFTDGTIEKWTDEEIRGILVTDTRDWMDWGEGWGENYETLVHRRNARLNKRNLRRNLRRDITDSEEDDCEEDDESYQGDDSCDSSDNYTEYDEDSGDDSDDDGCIPVTHWDTRCLSTHLGDSSPSYSRSPTPPLDSPSDMIFDEIVTGIQTGYEEPVLCHDLNPHKLFPTPPPRCRKLLERCHKLLESKSLSKSPPSRQKRKKKSQLWMKRLGWVGLFGWIGRKGGWKKMRRRRRRLRQDEEEERQDEEEEEEDNDKMEDQDEGEDDCEGDSLSEDEYENDYGIGRGIGRDRVRRRKRKEKKKQYLEKCEEREIRRKCEEEARGLGTTESSRIYLSMKLWDMERSIKILHDK